MLRENARALLCAVFAGSTLGLGLTTAYWVGSMVGSGSRAPASPATTPSSAKAQDAAALIPASQIGAPARDLAQDLDCLTQVVYYEARGESARGQAAVAQVVLNRVHHPAFPKTVCGVVFQRTGQAAGKSECQFSFVCDGSMERSRDPAAWRRARTVAAQVMAGSTASQVGAATNFHAVRLGKMWGDSLVRVAQVGLHVFYRFGHHRLDAPAEALHAVASPAPEADRDAAKPVLASYASPPPAQARDADPLDEPAKSIAASPLASAAAQSASPST
jgi:spore germination cell wall hydrolase CwlJ-like protein